MVTIIDHRMRSMVAIEITVMLPDGLWEHLGARTQKCALYIQPEVFVDWDAGVAKDEIGYLLSELARKVKTVKERT